MPLAGRWVKNRGRWVSIGDKEVKTRTLYSNERNVIRDKCEKKFIHGENNILSHIFTFNIAKKYMWKIF